MKCASRYSFMLLLKLALVYIVLCLLVAFFQRRLIYYPMRESEPFLRAMAKKLGVVPVTNAENVIVAWTRPVPQASKRVVMFHGNAGCALHRYYMFDQFQSETAGEFWQVFLFEYPGYGAHPGSPSERTIVRAAGDFIDTLIGQDGAPLFLLGESLGGGPACALAAARPDQIAGVLLITPFDTLTGAGHVHFPFLPIGWMLMDRYDSIGALKKYTGPLAILAAERDEVLPVRLAERLYASYAGRKRFWLIPNATHNEIPYAPSADWWREALEFLNSFSMPASCPGLKKPA
jgi:hypothetical protein